MELVNQELQHPDFIWTWKASLRGTRQSIWLHYLQSIIKKPRSKLWQLSYNGGSIDADLRKIDFFMLYGGCGNLPVEFLDDLNQQRICLAIHRRNMPRPYWFIPASGANTDDLLSAQIVARDNLNTSAYVARTIIREKFRSSEYLIPTAGSEYKRLAAARSIEEARQIEAQHAARYWDVFFRACGLPSEFAVRRSRMQSGEFRA